MNPELKKILTKKRKKGPSHLEEAMERRLAYCTLGRPVKEFLFCPSRKWRADFAYVNERILIEVDGGAFCGGRHNRGVGFNKDIEKLNTATIMGYSVLRYTPENMDTVCQDIQSLLNRRVTK